MKIAIAVASLSRLSPSTRRVRRAGAPRSRKIATTAAGSVVAMIAASSRQATSGTPGERPEREADRGRGREHGDHGQHEDRRRVLDQAPDVDRQRGLEQQDRQEDVQEPARGDREVQDQGGDLVEGVGERRAQQNAGADADDHADHGEQHAVRQVEPGGERLQQPDQDQQAGDVNRTCGRLTKRARSL